MNKYILSTFSFYKAEAFFRVKPFYCTNHERYTSENVLK
jgi:hypothetical protein